MLKQFGMEECATVSTPMTICCKLSNDEEYPIADATLYRSMIRGLLYLTASQPNIMKATGMVARFSANP